jgi:hypothetical protein
VWQHTLGEWALHCPPGPPGRGDAPSAFPYYVVCKPAFYGGFVRARRVIDREKRRSPAPPRAVQQRSLEDASATKLQVGAGRGAAAYLLYSSSKTLLSNIFR